MKWPPVSVTKARSAFGRLESRDRMFVLAGRGATGLLPLILLSYSSRALGLAATGAFAAGVATALGIADIADFLSERHVPRVAVRGVNGAHEERLAAFNGLRFITLIALTALALAVLVALTARDALLVNVAVLLVAGFALLTKTFYAAAIVDKRFALVGAGPVLALVLGVVSGAVLVRAGAGSLWTIVAALYVAKAGEVALLGSRLSWPRIGLRGALLREEWLQTRYLFAQGILSSGWARLIVPLVAAASGAVAAALLSFGLSLLSIISLMSIAITVPAYRHVLQAGPGQTPLDIFRRTRREWLLAVLLSALVVGAIGVVNRPLLHALFHVDAAEARWAIMLIVMSGVFETLALFAGTYYHASFRDRLFFMVSAVSTVAAYGLIFAGAMTGSVVGMAWGFLASRALGAVALYAPLLASARPTPTSNTLPPVGAAAPPASTRR